jgi:hypothetical protein
MSKARNFNQRNWGDYPEAASFGPSVPPLVRTFDNGAEAVADAEGIGFLIGSDENGWETLDLPLDANRKAKETFLNGFPEDISKIQLLDMGFREI